jgi:hypothetical protein
MNACPWMPACAGTNGREKDRSKLFKSQTCVIARIVEGAGYAFRLSPPSLPRKSRGRAGRRGSGNRPGLLTPPAGPAGPDASRHRRGGAAANNAAQNAAKSAGCPASRARCLRLAPRSPRWTSFPAFRALSTATGTSTAPAGRQPGYGAIAVSPKRRNVTARQDHAAWAAFADAAEHRGRPPHRPRRSLTRRNPKGLSAASPAPPPAAPHT